jgi:riboflavin-specific deaminase-like protein
MRLRKGLPEYNLRVVVSGSGNLNPKAEIFRHRFSPIIVLVTRQAPESNLRRLREVANEVKAFGDKQLNFTQALRWLREKWRVKRLLCEGGGEVNWGLFQEGLVDEVYHTLCPLVFGGRSAPTMADGHGFPALASATRLRLKSLKRISDELFLVWRTVK